MNINIFKLLKNSFLSYIPKKILGKNQVVCVFYMKDKENSILYAQDDLGLVICGGSA